MQALSALSGRFLSLELAGGMQKFQYKASGLAPRFIEAALH
jgi:hypothetical protein